MVVGATVSATGAGLACPDWPLCHGRLVPPLERLVLIEYGHRLLASAVGILMIGLAVVTWRQRPARRGLRGLMAGLLALLALQVGLGGATVLSELKPIIIGTHLTAAMIFLALLVVFAARAHWDGVAASTMPGPPPGLRRAVHVAVAAAFAQIVLGGFTSALGAGLACPEFPLCGSRLIPPADPLVLLHATHRVLAFVLAVAAAVAAARARASGDAFARRVAALVVLLVIVQITLGALNVVTRLALPVRIAHLGGAAALLAVLVALLVRVRLVAATAPDRAPRAAVSDYVALTKPRIIVLLLVTTATTMVVAGGRAAFAPALLAYTLLGGALAAGAANAINCYWDRDVDAVMRRTRGRPLPAGRVAPSQALSFGLVLSVVGVAVLGLGVNWLSAGLALSGILFYVFVYTMWLKRSTPQNIVIGGAAGAIPPLVGWAAMTNQVGVPALVLFAIIFLWTPPHFWALSLYRLEDYRAAGIPMLPVAKGEDETIRQIVLYTIALIAASLLMAGLGVLGWVYLAAAIVLAVPFVLLVVRLARGRQPRAAWVLFEYSILYLGLLFAAMALDRLIA
jgi:protoheme IX farnesyltransferase